jgi:hypothetical protein
MSFWTRTMPLAGCWTRVAFGVSLITAAGIFLLAGANIVPAAGVFHALPSHLDLLCRWAIGPVILGRAFDLTGSYSSLLVTLAVALCFAAAMNLLLPKYPNLSLIDLS